MPYTGGAFIDISQNYENFFLKNCLVEIYLKDAKFATGGYPKNSVFAVKSDILRDHQLSFARLFMQTMGLTLDTSSSS